MAKMPPPPSGHGVAIVIAAHPAGKERQPPPGWKAPDEEPMPGEEPEKDPNAKATEEEAGVVREDAHCSDCKFYDANTGECAKVEGNFAPSDGCARFFEAMSDEDEDEPDADDQGGAPDMDADDAQEGGAA